MPELLPILKTGTQEAHQSLEDRLDLFNRVTDLTAYQTLLEGFFTLYEPLENALAESADWSALGWNFDASRKTPWLRKDLRHLGLNLEAIEALPRCPDLPPLEDTAATVGCLYVLEGSTLGAQVITRRFATTLGLTPDTGGRFFAGYGDETVPHWRAFGTWVRSVEEGLDPARATATAKLTFETFDRWLNRSRPL